jgi:UDP-glucose 4-epimerase
MKVLITGGAGFIGSHLAVELLRQNHEIVVYDNLSTGQKQFLKPIIGSDSFQFIEANLLDTERLSSAMQGVDFVWHLAANADVRFGTQRPQWDLEQNTIATSNVLEAMRCNNVKNIAFSSTGSVYGEARIIPTREDCPFPVQTSLYGASKLACEGLISAYCEGFGMQAWVFRFVSIVGQHYTHGHIFDFYQQLRNDPDSLHVLGNGKQRKSYLHVYDCIDAMMEAINSNQDAFSIFNLGTDEYIEVNDSIDIITDHLGLNPERSFEKKDRGWIGDNPFIFLDCSRIRALGWKPRYSIREGVVATLQWLIENHWIYQKRQ